jgi:hypothetical protein
MKGEFTKCHQSPVVMGVFLAYGDTNTGEHDERGDDEMMTEGESLPAMRGTP